MIRAFGILIGLGLVAGFGYMALLQVRANTKIVEDGVCACNVGEHEATAADVEQSTVSPMLSAPVKLRRSFRILCSSVDAGSTVTECGVPVDGGTAGYPIVASSIYVAPTTGSTVKIRVGSADVTSSTGIEVGTGARDGVGINVDAAGCWCKSEGAAQAADVVIMQ